MKSEMNITVTPPRAFNRVELHILIFGFPSRCEEAVRNQKCDMTNELCTVLECYCKVGAVEKRNRAE